MGGRVNDTSAKEGGIRILVVEANAKAAAAVRNSLKAAAPNFVISPARQLWSASQILAGMPIDAVLLGLDLPDCEGISALAELRQHSPDTPVLIVGKDRQLGQEAVEAGADDYLGPDEIEPSTIGSRVLDAIERRRQSAPPVQEAEPKVEASSANILVVEEDPWVQSLLKRNLSRRGHSVEVVSSPQDALAWGQGTDDDRLDLLICDVHPPGMDGPRLSGHLSKQFPSMVTLLVSANGHQPAVVTERPQAFAFLSKPYSLDDFQATVDELIAGVASAPV